MRVSFNWLKDYVDIRIGPEAIAEKLTMVGLEVTSLTNMDQDKIMEIEVTPNRPDCLSVIGIAREISAITGRKLKVPRIGSCRGKSKISIFIQVKDKELCPRYLGRVIRNVHLGPSPAWLAQRLEVMGIRAVNNIVDITNFCLLEFGQPLHAFDLDKLEGGKIIIRRAQEGEKVTTIDGVERDLDPSMLVIADKFNPQAIAGVMGAKMSEVGQETTNIMLESAYFAPRNIHNTSRKLGLATQSSYRFERGVDFQAVYLASLRATGLIERLAQASKKTFSVKQGKGKIKPKAMVIGKLIDKGKKKETLTKVRLRFARVKRLLGSEISSAKAKEILGRLQFRLLRRSPEGLVAEVPSFRADISREADLIEEVARLYGYDKVPLRLTQLIPNLSQTGKLELKEEEHYHKARQILASLGCHEIMTYSLIGREALRKLEWPQESVVTVRNPLSYAQEILRPTLMAGILSALMSNVNRKNLDLKLFELSRVYCRLQQQKIDEVTHLCIAVAGEKGENWMQKLGKYSFFDLKGILETLLYKMGLEEFSISEAESAYFTPHRCARLLLEGEDYGYLGEVRQGILARFDISYPVYLTELRFDKLLKHVRPEKRFVPLAKFPSIERDISLIAPRQVQSQEILSLIKKIGRELVAQIKLFDQYHGEQIPAGSRGLAYSIEYRSKERTLTAEEVDRLHEQIRQALIKELPVQIR